MRESSSPFGLRFYVVAWVAAGGVFILGNTYPQNIVYLELWILVTAWVLIVSAYTRFFGETAHCRRLSILRQRKLCVGCGYDLRATDSRCPECGKELPATKERIEALETLAGPPTLPVPQPFDYEALSQWRGQELSRAATTPEFTETTPSTSAPPPLG